ncbi:MAG: methyl-accepting chemotaxis protein [bacterium]|nr:methyl-accepting chemotaxis protein [bacterium]
MFRTLKLNTLLLLGFTSVILVFLIVGIVSIQKMNALSDLTSKMYRHPFTVTSAVLSIERDVTAIHRDMKDIALTSDASQIAKYSNKINQREQEIAENFRIVSERFLGDMELVRTAEKDYKNWGPIRNNVIRLMSTGDENDKSEAIAITKNDGANQVTKLNNSILALREYAANKAITFNENTISVKNSTLTIIYTLLGAAIVVAIFMANLITRNVKRQLGCDPSEAASIVKQFSTGDLNIDFTSGKQFGLYKDIQHMVETLSSMVGNIKAVADELATASLQVSNTARDLAQGASEQASTVEEISSTMEEMAANISLNDQHAQESKSISLQAKDSLLEVNDQARKSVDANKLIANKIQIINDITRQTNMLSINASVEAAAAGERGKGFAVIAGEIRKLADRSKKAASEIIEITQNGYRISQETGEKLNQMIPEIEKTTQLVQEIAVANGEHNHGTNQVNQAIQQLNSVSQSNASSGEQLAANSQQMSDQARYLSNLIKFFKLEKAI